MNLLLDTHTLLWFFWDDAQLSLPAKRVIEDPNNRHFVSLVTCWEVSIKAGIGTLQLGAPAAVFLPREISKNAFDLLPIELTHVTAVEPLPLHHRDPFDRLLVAQALIDRIPLVSADAVFDQYGITRLW